MVVDLIARGSAVEPDDERAEHDTDGERHREEKQKTDGRFRAQRFVSG
jgi:hypothetical protein